ncbi:MAG: helix-turn-helix transcriptional regulator [Microbacterium sp.]|nr:helix-turn-helix transcriptional regulator [Microbacterium sp.]
MPATILGRTQEEPSALSSLSGRERQVLAHLRTTMTPAEIAVALDVSLNTLKTHQRAIYRKLGVSTRRAATRLRE